MTLKACCFESDLSVDGLYGAQEIFLWIESSRTQIVRQKFEKLLNVHFEAQFEVTSGL